MKNILIIGSTGMLGNTLKEYLTIEGYKVKTLNRNNLDLSECSRKELWDKVIEYKCELLINCAGLIKQRSGIKTSDFVSINSLLPHRLADICEEENMKMIHFTTDCVFDGILGDYNELDKSNVHDDYGKSKSLGEPNNCTVIRTSIIGEEENNKLSLLEWVLSNKDTTINGYTNHVWNGITCIQLGKIIKRIIDDNLFWDGVRHFYTDDAVNKYDLVRMINEIYKLDNVVVEHKSGKPVIRTLKTNYDITGFKIPFLYKQIEETKEFHDNIRNERLKEYYSNLL